MQIRCGIGYSAPQEPFQFHLLFRRLEGKMRRAVVQPMSDALSVSQDPDPDGALVRYSKDKESRRSRTLDQLRLGGLGTNKWVGC